GARAGELLREKELIPDVVYTSRLKRAILTANIALEAADLSWLDVHRSWRLNERHYGALQGKNKKEIREEFGEEQFMIWRRSFDTPPPALADSSEFSQAGEARYANLGDSLPRTECLADVIDRLLPHWYAVLGPGLSAAKTVLVAAPGNPLRQPRCFAAAHRVPGRCPRPPPALPVRRPGPRTLRRKDRARGRPRQFAARVGQAPRRNLRCRHHGPEHPDRHPPALRTDRGL